MTHKIKSVDKEIVRAEGIPEKEVYLDTSDSWLFAEMKRLTAEYPLFTPEEERAQLERYAILRKEFEVHKEDNSLQEEIYEIEKEFVCRNGGLVLSLYKKQRGYSKHAEREELLQEGRWGIVIALRKFDLEKASRNKRFSTYAIWWIKEAISSHLQEHGNLIQVPVNMSEDVFKLDELLTEEGVRSRCIELGYSKVKIENRVAAVRAMNEPFSLNDESVDFRDRDKAHNYLSKENDGLSMLDERMEVSETLKKILRYCKVRNLRTFGIYMLRSGILGDVMTFRGISRIFDMSKQQAQQISSSVLWSIESGSILKLNISEISDKELATSLTDLCELPYLLCENLSEREYRLVCLRFGIAFVNNPHHPSEIAETFEMNREQVERELGAVLEKLETFSIDDPNTNMEIPISEYLLNRMENLTG
ncbi:sigma-70 family RNA polymerase sigma factor [bacterium]|nr:sigma-70 family RNA polymerase sigma factor [bacterium]